jgi:hypothetical protein
LNGKKRISLKFKYSKCPLIFDKLFVETVLGLYLMKILFNEKDEVNKKKIYEKIHFSENIYLGISIFEVI